MPNQKTYPSAFDLARCAELPVIWFFYAEGCELCRTQEKMLLQAQEELRGKARFYRADVARHPAFYAHIGITKTPMVAVSRGGRARWRGAGLTGAAEIVAAALAPPDPASYSAAQTAHKN